MIGEIGFYFASPWWLLSCALLVPLVWMGRKNLRALGKMRRILAIALRVVVILLLILVLSEPTISEKGDRVTVIAVLDRSESIPAGERQKALAYLKDALTRKQPRDKFGLIDVGETAIISRLPSVADQVYERSVGLTGTESRLSDGVELGMAVAPAETGTRILLISDGNETAGDLKESARTAAANRIPIDVLAIPYQYRQEVLFKRLVAPSKARSGQTVGLRFVLNSTARARGKLVLNLNGKPVDLDPGSDEIAVPVELIPGTNVKTVSVPLGTRGMHKFDTYFIPDGEDQDHLTRNNRAGAITMVAGPGHVMVIDTGDESAKPLVETLRQSEIETRYIHADEFPRNLADLLATDAVVFVNTDASCFTFAQQEMLRRYVNDVGGGLVMVGGPKSFGAGGWIGSPLAEVLPVDLDPPQKKQMPKGALVLIMHACEMPQGNYWGREICKAAVKSLSRRDLLGVLDWEYNVPSREANWVIPLGPLGDKKAAIEKLNQMVMGDMPDFQPHLQAAYDKLTTCDAAQKHIILISDGDSQPPTDQMLRQLRDARIACTTVTIFPHQQFSLNQMQRIARITGGRSYNIKTPDELPRIVIKEAQIVSRTLIQEKTFTPKLVYSISETVRGLGGAFPQLDGFVLTGPRGGLTQVVLNSDGDDPILATGQMGLGRSVAFTSSADTRWSSRWVTWSGFHTFWEQVIRWVSKPGQLPDCEVFTEVRGQDVTVTVEAMDDKGKFVEFADITGQVIAPDMSAREISLTQVGPGRYQAKFQGGSSGTYMVNLRYRRPGQTKRSGVIQSAVTVPFAPEYRDLSDNASLLGEVAEITGGRVLPPDPLTADIFSRTAVNFPQTATVLTKPLMLIWVVVFLLDVAVRRIAIDLRPIFHRLGALLRQTRSVRAGESTLGRLRMRREQLRQRLAPKVQDPMASRRYEASERDVSELPSLPVPATPAEPARETEEPVEAESPTQEEASTLQQLLKAKRRTTRGRRDDNTDNPGSGDR